MTAEKKRQQISAAYLKRSDAIRSSDPASAKLKNRALSAKAESRLAKTKEGKRFNALVERRVRQSTNLDASLSGGKGSKATRRMIAMGLKAKRGRPAGPSGGKVGTRTEQRKSAAAQASRSKAFSGKSTAGRSAKAAYDAARSSARFARTAASLGGGKSAVKSSAARVARMESSRSTAGSAKRSRSTRYRKR